MTFQEALVLAHDSEKLVGTTFNGETIEEVLIVPTDKVLHDRFFHGILFYTECKNSHSSIYGLRYGGGSIIQKNIYPPRWGNYNNKRIQH